MTHDEMKETVMKVMQAPSCCKALKEAGQNWLAAIGSGNEKEAGAELLAELKEDVCTIDDFIGLTESPFGYQIFGKENSLKMHEQGIAAKEQGARYCLCEACTQGGKILDDPSLLL